jgi:hypothetical protein
MSLRLIPLMMLALLALPIQAAEVLGQVTEQGRPLAGVEVTLSRPDGVVAGQAMSDRDGRFRFEVKPGQYRLGVFRDDYAPVKRDGIRVGTEAVEVAVEIVPAAFADDQAQPEGGCD